MKSPLIGRARDLATLLHWLTQPEKRLITVTGPGGVGKTRLAQAALAEQNGAYQATTVVMLDRDPAPGLAALPTPDLLLSAIARELHLPEAGHLLLHQVIQALGSQPHLLLLDNFEHLIEAAPVISALVAACPALTVLVTSREALCLQPEAVYVLRPLAGSPQTHPSLSEVERSPAGALFLARARAANPAFAPSEADAAAIAEICARLGGLPLALELAAARISVLAPAELARRLDHHLLRLLARQGRDMPGRLLSMRESVAWGYDLLGPEEQRLFRRVALFRSGFTLDAAARVVAAGDDPFWVEQALEALIAKHLVHHAPAASDAPRSEILPPRFEMLEPIREYASGLLTPAEREETEHLRAQWCRELCLAVTPHPFNTHLFGPRSREWEQRLAEEHGTLRVVLAWAIEQGQTEADTALLLAGTLADYWYRRGQLTEGHAWLLAARRLATGASVAEVKVLTGAALVAASSGDLDLAQTCGQQAVALARQTGDAFAIPGTLAILGHVNTARGASAEAYRLQQEALRLVRELGEPTWTSTVLLGLALNALRLGRIDAAAAHSAESAAIAREIGDPWLLTHALRVAGCVACEQGDAGAAAAAFAEGLALSREPSAAGRWGRADALANCAMLAMLHGEPERAARLIGAAEALYAAIGVGLPPPDRPLYAAAREAVVTALAPHAERFVREGASAPLDAAFGEAETLLSDIRQRARSILSDREAQVLDLIARGMSDKMVSQALHISLRTAQDHAQAIRTKLGVNSRAGAVNEARRLGLL